MCVHVSAEDSWGQRALSADVCRGHCGTVRLRMMTIEARLGEWACVNRYMQRADGGSGHEEYIGPVCL